MANEFEGRRIDTAHRPIGGENLRGERFANGGLVYNFNVFSIDKTREKLEYIHNNPVRKGLVANAQKWSFGSARWYLLQRSVGVEIAALS